MRDAWDVLDEALRAIVATGECVITERPAGHVPLSARVSSSGVVTPCGCSGCVAASKCKCASCLAARRHARSAESDRGASASTADEIAADALYEAARPYLDKRPHRNRIAFTNQRTSRTAWTTLAAFLSRMPGAPVVDANRLRMICKTRRK